MGEGDSITMMRVNETIVYNSKDYCNTSQRKQNVSVYLLKEISWGKH